MFSIGEFSKITGLTVKTLRFYHEQGVLTPTCVDDQSGYRYYDAGKVEAARVIRRLRQMEFSLEQIAEILRTDNDEGDILDHLERQRTQVGERARHFQEVRLSLDRIIAAEREARRVMQNAHFEIEEKIVESQLIAGVRMKGRYGECGQAFSQIGRQFGRYICGKPMLLIYDDEYRENDADFEPCMPIRQGAGVAGISVRELPGGRCVTLLHKGPYPELGRSYEKILKFAKEKGYAIELPCREVYLKGPGMIFKGNPLKYLTEIQMRIKPTP